MNALVVGSSDIDIFVKPKNSSSFVEDHKTVAFTLGDKVPININLMTLGGNAANVSVGLKRLGVDTSLYTYLGKDILSRQVIESLEKEKINLVSDTAVGENTSLSLIFDFSKDRIIFSHHEERDHTFDSSKASGFDSIYLTSIGAQWKEAYKSVLEYAHSNSINLAFSPGSAQLADLDDIIFEIIAVSKILFVNKEEGEKIVEKKDGGSKDMKELLQKLSELGTQIVSVTDGKNGAYAYSNNNFYVLPSFDGHVLSADKTGAGDSYASGFFAALLLGKDVKTSMMWGAVNANSVMGKIGAQAGLLSPEEIGDMLLKRPDFQVKTL